MPEALSFPLHLCQLHIVNFPSSSEQEDSKTQRSAHTPWQEIAQRVARRILSHPLSASLSHRASLGGMSLIHFSRTSAEIQDCLGDAKFLGYKVVKYLTEGFHGNSVDGNCAIWLLRVLMPLSFITSFERRCSETP